MTSWHPGGHSRLVAKLGTSARAIGFARWNEKPLLGLALGYVADLLLLLTVTFGSPWLSSATWVCVCWLGCLLMSPLATDIPSLPETDPLIGDATNTALPFRIIRCSGRFFTQDAQRFRM